MRYPTPSSSHGTRTGATIHEVREFAGHADIRTIELDLVHAR